MKKFLQEFKSFAMKGNVLDLAVGVIIGAAFQAVVASLTKNILAPIIGLFAKQNFDALHWEVLGTTIGYGAFITSLINFTIMAFVVFLLVKAMNRLASIGKKKEEKEPETKKCPYCLNEINIKATRCPACTSHLQE
mgnify:FL=1